MWPHWTPNDLREVEKRVAAGDERARLVFDALCLQIAKEIGGSATVLKGQVDAIVLTGGLTYSDRLCEAVTARIRKIGRAAPTSRPPRDSA